MVVVKMKSAKLPTVLGVTIVMLSEPKSASPPTTSSPPTISLPPPSTSLLLVVGVVVIVDSSYLPSINMVASPELFSHAQS